MQATQNDDGRAGSSLSLWLPPALIFFANGAIYGTWAAQVPVIKERIGISDADFGALLMAMGAGAVIAMTVSGWLLPRFGTGRLMAISFAVFVGSLLALSITSSNLVFTLALLTFGAFGGLMDVAMNAFAAESEGKIGRPVMSSIHGMWNVGGLAGAGLAGILISTLGGPAEAMVASAALVLILLPIRSRLSSTIPASRRATSTLQRQSIYVWLIGILAALCFSAEGSVRDWSSLYLNNELNLSVSMAAWGYAAFSALMAAGRLGGDYSRQLWGDRLTIVGSGLVAAAGFYLSTTSGNLVMIFVSFALIGLGLSNIVPTIVSAAGRQLNPQASITVVVALGYSGYLASPPVLGLIVSATSLAGMFRVIAGVCVAISVGWFIMSLRASAAPARE